MLSSWSQQRKARLEKIRLKQEQKPDAPLLEEMKERGGLRETKMRKLVERSENIAKDASRDDYI